MKHPWLAYVIVGVLSIGAGVAIAGLPNNVPVEATIIPPTTTEAPGPIVPTATEPETTEPDGDPRQPGTTDPRRRCRKRRSPTTPCPETTDSVPAVLPERSELNVAAANGADVAGAALRMATQLEELGYVDVLPTNGSDIVEFTAVYYANGFEESALRLAEDLDLLPDFVGQIENAPSVPDLPADVELLVYIGRDRA